MPLTRPRTASRNVWEEWSEKFGKFGWEHLPLTKEFRKRFVLQPKLLKLIFSNENFSKIMPNTIVLTQRDFFLAMLYRLKKACDFSTIEDVFGGDEKTHSNNFAKFINASMIMFKNAVRFPTVDEALEKVKFLHDNAFPSFSAPFTADCMDSPIASSDPDYYTPKKSCPSQHAIRVFLFLISLATNHNTDTRGCRPN